MSIKTRSINHLNTQFHNLRQINNIQLIESILCFIRGVLEATAICNGGIGNLVYRGNNKLIRYVMKIITVNITVLR